MKGLFVLFLLLVAVLLVLTGLGVLQLPDSTSSPAGPSISAKQPVKRAPRQRAKNGIKPASSVAREQDAALDMAADLQ